MKKLAILFAVLLMITLVACGSTEIPSDPTLPVDTQPVTTEATEETTVETTEAVPQLEVYYDRDETINLYLNYFNEINPDSKIDSALFEVYYHHGKEHDNQIIFTRDDVEVVVSGHSFDNSVEIVIDGSKEKTWDDYKLLFKQYGKAFSQDLTDEKLEEYWQTVLDDIINDVDFDEFDCSLHTYNDEIEYMIIEGKLK